MKPAFLGFFVAAAQLLPLAVYAQSLNLGYASVLQQEQGVTSLFYPTLEPESTQQRGPFTLSWADGARPAPANGKRRLIVISHGSGGAPWVHTDLARALVRRGFVVAVPQHAGDSLGDDAEPGPQSWKRRPTEVSHAIDLALAMPLFLETLDPSRVGVFGGSAGGHTALSMAGGVWSPARFRDHCLAHIREDFSSCVGFTTLLTGGLLDNAKLWLAKRVIASRFSDETPQSHHNPRVKAVVAMVPFAADFDPASLATPRVPLGLVTAVKDVNQVARFHINAIKAACLPRCTDLMTLPEAGHGAMLSPLPPLTPGSIAHQLLADPPGFDRATVLPQINARIADFFARHLAD
jgi:predicted dienelactone hydrolase